MVVWYQFGACGNFRFDYDTLLYYKFFTMCEFLGFAFCNG
jgi:hypothetical protein